MVNSLIIAGFFGCLGGFARAAVGVLKALRRKEKITLKIVLITLLASGIIGIFTGLLYDTNYKITLIAGYAGTDLIEGLYKVRYP